MSMTTFRNTGSTSHPRQYSLSFHKDEWRFMVTDDPGTRRASGTSIVFNLDTAQWLHDWLGEFLHDVARKTKET